MGNPGDNILGEAGAGWNTFGSYAEITDLGGSPRLWFREVMQEKYLPFTYGLNGNTNADNVSAEFYCHDDVLNYDNWEWINNPQFGQTYYCVAWNVKLSDIHGYKWNDLNGDRMEDAGEPRLSGWEIFIDENGNGRWDEGEPKTITSSDPDPQHFGWYWFENLLPGEYKICETQQTGWTQTHPGTPIEPVCHTINLPNDCDEYAGNGLVARIATPNFVETYCEFNFGNHEEPSLLIEKSNNSVAPQAPGTDVIYTLLITAKNNNVNGVVVTDLPPAGFSYRPGSWTAFSDVRGNLKGLGITTEPTYASPGDWNLGDMISGEQVTLTYIADISGEQDSGLYKDLAWAKGLSDTNNSVLANDQEATPFFVGTSVAVIMDADNPVKVSLETDTKTKTKTKTKEVLGAATGTNTTWLILALILLLAGIISIFIGKYMQSKKTGLISKAVIIAALAAGIISGSNAVMAATQLAVQIGEPESPTRTADFKIGFVALDIENRTVDAQCYKKGAPDTAIATEYTAKDGGNSGNCVVDSSVMPADGTYEFFVTVNAGADSATSETVSVELNTSRPGTPKNYDRDDLNDCQNKITFRTANDAITTRVELYRSKDTDFTANDAAKVDEKNILPDTNGSFVNTVPDCDEDYFYAVRAFDEAGNGSGVVGDVKVKTETETRTRTVTIPGPAAIPVLTPGTEETPAEGEVAGEAGGEGLEIGEEGEEEGAEVLGEEVSAEKSAFKNPLLWIVIAIILGIIFYAYRTRKNAENESA